MNTPTRSTDELYSCPRCGLTVGGENSSFSPPNILHSFCTSNKPPSPDELGSLRAGYETISRSESTLDSEISRLEASLADLKEKKQKTGELLAVYRSVFSPLRQYPNEILGQIFGLCVEESERDYAYHDAEESRSSKYFSLTIDTGKCPWVLGQVCRRWRGIALSLPDLWTRINVDGGALPPEIVEDHVERRVSMALERARDRPLSVSLSQDSCRERVFSMVCSRSSQWKDAYIFVGISGLKMLTPCRGSFPMLSTLYLDLEEDGWQEHEQDEAVKNAALSVFCDAPELHKVTLTGYLAPITSPLITQIIPWKQITRLEMNPYDSGPDIRPIIPLLTNVSSCELGTFLFPGGPLMDPSTLLNLHTLALTSTLARIPVDPLLDSVTLPALKKFDLRSGTSSIMTVVRFLERSSCRLEDLSLFRLDSRDLIEVLQTRAVQSVRVFSVRSRGVDRRDSHGGVDDRFLEALKLKQTNNDTSRGDNALRHLSELSLVGPKQWSDSSLVEMLASRAFLNQTLPLGTSRLTVVSFGLTGVDGLAFEDEAARVQMRGLIDGGLIVEVDGEVVSL
ncbi:hypothetical protein V5O48_010972 [Marasmius crinis-equi]|uniref:F-box domain-containing protein n=1 Tax=Marasmius crinis-equi TaxID=585013 RepID=A0ABR3F6U6_9AGAR